MTFAQKIRTAGALVFIFLLILATNLIDNHHFKIVQQSLTTVYEDRLVAKKHIYGIARQLQLKQNSLQNEDWNKTSKTIKAANDSIDVLINKFEKTRLTQQESSRFEALQNNLNELTRYESRYLADSVPGGEGNWEKYYNGIFKNLDALSEIQIGEGKRELHLSNQSINTSNLISKIEIGVLIFIGILLQLLIFLKPMK